MTGTLAGNQARILADDRARILASEQARILVIGMAGGIWRIGCGDNMEW